MAKPAYRLALFTAADPLRAAAAVLAFDAAAARLGMPWRGASVPPAALVGVGAVVSIEGAPVPDGWSGRVEKWNAALDTDAAAAGLIARLLGGTDEEPSKPPRPRRRRSTR